MRNILIHDYSTTSIERVWSTIRDDVPRLADVVPAMLKKADSVEHKKRAA